MREERTPAEGNDQPNTEEEPKPPPEEPKPPPEPPKPPPEPPKPPPGHEEYGDRQADVLEGDENVPLPPDDD